MRTPAPFEMPEPEIAAAWAREAEDRLAAYQRGEIQAMDEDEVFGDLDDAPSESRK